MNSILHSFQIHNQSFLKAKAVSRIFKMQFIKSAVTGYDTSPYTVKQTFKEGIEERIYPAQKWATTERTVAGTLMDEIRTEMFFTLFGYISGKNEKNQKIAMTVPVSTKVEKLPENKMSYQMGFYVPKEFQADPPQPSDEKVKIVERDLHVYTIQFSGYAKAEQYDEKYQELLKFLKSENISLPVADDSKEPIRYNVGYDSPAKFWNRRNEVWIQGE